MLHAVQRRATPAHVGLPTARHSYSVVSGLGVASPQLPGQYYPCPHPILSSDAPTTEVGSANVSLSPSDPAVSSWTNLPTAITEVTTKLPSCSVPKKMSPQVLPGRSFFVLGQMKIHLGLCPDQQATEPDEEIVLARF